MLKGFLAKTAQKAALIASFASMTNRTSHKGAADRYRSGPIVSFERTGLETRMGAWKIAALIVCATGIAVLIITVF